MVAPRALGEHRLVGIDTNVFVYAFEDYPDFGSQCRAVRADARSLRLPDAVHIATAISKGATALISNDARLPAVAGLTIVRLG